MFSIDVIVIICNPINVYIQVAPLFTASRLKKDIVNTRFWTMRMTGGDICKNT